MVDSHMTDERKAACNSPNKPTSGGIEKDMTAFTVIVAAKQTESGAFYYERPSAITFCLWWLNEVELFSDKSLQDTPDDAFSILSIGLPNGIDDLGAYADRTIIHEVSSISSLADTAARRRVDILIAFTHMDWWRYHPACDLKTTRGHRCSVQMGRHPVIKKHRRCVGQRRQLRIFHGRIVRDRKRIEDAKR